MCIYIYIYIYSYIYIYIYTTGLRRGERPPRDHRGLRDEDLVAMYHKSDIIIKYYHCI